MAVHDICEFGILKLKDLNKESSSHRIGQRAADTDLFVQTEIQFSEESCTEVRNM